jgi:hypothetical protein
MKRPNFGYVLKIGNFSSDVKGLLRTTGVQISAKVLATSRVTVGAH